MRDPSSAAAVPTHQWRAVRLVHREAVVLLGGGRALLMQLAHPAVALGVAEHSRYHSDRLGRLLGTLRPMFAITFGSHVQAVEAVDAIRATHEAVRGPAYRASDPALLAWVLATLIDSGLLMYERFVGPLSAAITEEYYVEMLDLGSLLGMSREVLPPRRHAFEEYMAQMVASLDVTPPAREIADDLFAPLHGSGPAMLLLRALTAELLPPQLREAYGLTSNPVQQAGLAVAMRISRASLPFVPPVLRRTPSFLLPPRDARA